MSHPQACGGRSLSHGGARPPLSASILGPPPPGSVGPRRSPLSAVYCAPPLLRLSLRGRGPRPGQLRGSLARPPSSAEARAPSAPGRLPREGARPPPRLHPLCGDAAIWGPCQSCPLWGPRLARAGGGSPWQGPGPPHRATPLPAPVRGAGRLDAPRGQWL